MVAVALAGGCRFRERLSVSVDSGAAPAAPAASSVAAPEASSPSQAPRVPTVAAPEVLSPRAIAALALPAIARVECEDHVGAAFFISGSVAVTNAHVACPQDESQLVVLHDGRRIRSRTLSRDEGLDVARILVPGANVRPLRAGDATALAPGDHIVIIGSPRGLDFSLHEGSVSYVGRAIDGIGYLQLSANVNPGNSGGPVLDERGRVVGIVTLKADDAEGIGFALPIQYAVTGGEADDDLDGGAAQARWEALIRRVHAEELAQAVDQTNRLTRDQPELWGLELDPKGRAIAVFVERTRTAPKAGPLDLELFTNTVEECRLKAPVPRWTLLGALDGGVAELPSVKEASRQLAPEEVFVGTATLARARCGPRPAEGLSVLVLKGGEPSADPLELDDAEAAAVRRAGR
jgi:serine protease Do